MRKYFCLMVATLFSAGAFAAGTGSTDTRQASQPSDAEIMKIVDTANMAEVNAAKLALKKSKSAEVKDFAKHMRDEHTKNTKESKSLAKKMKLSPKDDQITAQLKTDAKSKMDSLKTKSGKDFDEAYISGQIDMHKQVLNDLQQTLIPAAKSDQLKSFLQDTANHVQQHLDQATKIQASLK